jgi:NADH:ubiquinone oxidoreductase subunit 6 (subunit J)
VIFAALLLLGVVFFVAQAPHALSTGFHGNFNAVLLKEGNVQAFGRYLFTQFVFPFEITPLLLIVAMIGAVALGRRPGPPDHRAGERGGGTERP